MMSEPVSRVIKRDNVRLGGSGRTETPAAPGAAPALPRLSPRSASSSFRPTAPFSNSGAPAAPSR